MDDQTRPLGRPVAAADGLRADRPRQGRPDQHLRQARRRCADQARPRGRDRHQAESGPVLKDMPIMKLRTLALAMALTFGPVAAVTLPGVSLAQSQASKQAVDAAKAAGKVGEQGDGYLGIIADADSA